MLIVAAMRRLARFGAGPTFVLLTAVLVTGRASACTDATARNLLVTAAHNADQLESCLPQLVTLADQGAGKLRNQALDAIGALHPSKADVNALTSIAADRGRHSESTRLAALIALRHAELAAFSVDDQRALVRVAVVDDSALAEAARETLADLRPADPPADVQDLVIGALNNAMGATRFGTPTGQGAHAGPNAPYACPATSRPDGYKNAISLAQMIWRLGPSWKSLKNPLVNAMACAPPHNEELIAGLTSAYASVARPNSDAIEYLSENVLTAHGPASDCRSGSATGPPLTATDLQRNGRPLQYPRPWPLVYQPPDDGVPGHAACFRFDIAAREASAVALLEHYGLIQTYFPILAPALLSNGNAALAGNPTFLTSLLSVGPEDKYYGYRLYVAAGSLAAYVASTNLARPDQKSEAAAVFGKTYGAFESYAKARVAGSRALGMDRNFDTEIAGTLAAAGTFNDAVAQFADSAPAAVSTDALSEIQKKVRLGFLYVPVTWFTGHVAVGIGIAVVGAWLALILLMPITVLRCEVPLTALREVKVLGVGELVNAGLTLSLLRSPYVQDRWIRAFMKHARPSSELQFLRSFYPLPILIQDQLSEKPYPVFKVNAAVLEQTAAKRIMRCLISGEGGIGKTTLARYIASLAMHEDERSRLFRHYAIPISITSDVDLWVMSQDQVAELVIAKLEAATDAKLPLSKDFVLALLESKRLLLIIDGMSEMAPSVCEAVKAFLLGGKPRAVIITSRSETVVGQLAVVTMRPQRIDHTNLIPFLTHYAWAHGFSFTEPVQLAGERIAAISGESATPLLVTLFLAMMADEATRSLVLSQNVRVPSLMKAYVAFLNDKVGVEKLPTDQVLRAAKLIASLCCIESRTFRSSPIDTSEARAAVEQQPAVTLDYFFDRLSLLYRVEDQDKARFAIDSICEYLAGYYVADEFCEEERRALALLTVPDHLEQRAALKDFLTVIEECIAAEMAERGDFHPRSRTLKKLREELTNVRMRLESDIAGAA
jgi:hypothetical protein